jgi:hypothetical protein
MTLDWLNRFDILKNKIVSLYRIQFQNEKSLMKGLECLLKNGFVFSGKGRYKSIKEIKNRYISICSNWKYIFLGHIEYCKMVINASPDNTLWWSDYDCHSWNSVSLEDFVDKVLPTY